MSIKDYLPAPSESTDIILQAATTIAHRINSEPNKEELIRSIGYAWNECIFETDGYHLARILDDDCGYEIDSFFIDSLDDMEYQVGHLIKEARREWIEKNNIVPELEIGTVLKNVPKGPGTIVGVCEFSPGYYLVQRECDNDNSKLLVKFEDALIKG